MSSPMPSPRPPRLQHSPSLPNIPYTKNMQTTKPVLTTILTRTTKTHARRRTESNSLLLTPPLTPSSSIRTTASQTSSTAEQNDREEIIDPNPEATRILLIGNLNRQASGEKIRSAIVDVLFASTTSKENVSKLFTNSPSNDNIVKGSNELDLHTKGNMYIVFWDVRVAKKAQDILLSNDILGLQPYLSGEVDEDGKPLGFSAQTLTLNDLPTAISHSRILEGVEDQYILQLRKVDEDSATQTDSEGDVKSFFRQGINVSIIQNMLKSFGSLRFFRLGSEDTKTTLTYTFEFFDIKDGVNVVDEMDDKVFFGIKVNVLAKKGNETRLNPSGETVGGLDIVAAGAKFQMRARFNPIQTNATSPTFFYSSPPFDGQYAPSPLPQQPAFPTTAVSQHYTPDIESSCQYCPSKHSSGMAAHCTNINFGTHYPVPPPPRIYYTPAVSPIHHPYDYYPVDPQHLQVPAPNVSPVGPWTGVNYNFDPAIAAVSGGPPSAPYLMREDMISPGPQYYYPPSYIPTPDQQNFFPPQHQQVILPANAPSPQAFAHISPPTSSDSPSTSAESMSQLVKYEPAKANARLSTSGQGERNQLNIHTIESGEDMRTTVMIKNIPNKMSDVDLQNYIAQVCPRKIDFMYLRIDFKNGCNVGYAFVNFITLQDLLYFAKERLGTKWNMFSSEKILQMSYATYQGKEALVEKFKNSHIMDECEAWRPRIFYSSGPEQGLPEPFPAPTHIRRKERSSYNRGALFPPGTSSHSSYGHTLLNNAQPRRFVEDRARNTQKRNNNDNHHISIDALANRVRRTKLSNDHTSTQEERGAEKNTNNNNTHMNMVNYRNNNK